MLRFLEIPLALDAGTLGTIVVMVISFIVWAVNQATSKAKEEDQKKRQAQALARQRARQQQQMQQRQQQGQQGGRPQPRASQEAEVDAFLRSAAQQRQDPAAQRPPSLIPAAQRPPQPARPAQRPPQRVQQSQQRPPQPRRAAPPPQRQMGNRAAALYDGLETADFGSSAAAMGHLEGHEHDIEEHVHEVFDHDISKLDDNLAARDLDTFGDTSLLDTDLHPRQAAATQSAAQSGIEANIVEMFRNPANIRNAVVMQEILRRPSF